jgi:hypothetical protein
VTHWEKENDLLPPLIGETVQTGLNEEHQAIRQELEKSKQILLETSSERLTRDEMMARLYTVRQSTEQLTRLIEAHTAKEDVVLELAKKAIQAKSPKRTA